jgi:hypothetical protein
MSQSRRLVALRIILGLDPLPKLLSTPERAFGDGLGQGPRPSQKSFFASFCSQKEVLARLA